MFEKSKNLNAANQRISALGAMIIALGFKLEDLEARGETALKEEWDKAIGEAETRGKETASSADSELEKNLRETFELAADSTDLVADLSAIVEKLDTDLTAASGKATKAEGTITALCSALVEAKIFPDLDAAAKADSAGIKKALADRIKTAAAEELALHGIQPGDRPEGKVSPDSTKPGAESDVSPREARAAKLREKHGIS